MARDGAAWLERKVLSLPHRHDQGSLLRLHHDHAQPFANSADARSPTTSRRGRSRCSSGPKPANGRSGCSASACTICRSRRSGGTRLPLPLFDGIEDRRSAIETPARVRARCARLRRALRALVAFRRLPRCRDGFFARARLGGCAVVAARAALRSPAARPRLVLASAAGRDRAPRPAGCRLRASRLRRASTSTTGGGALISCTTSPSTTSLPAAGSARRPLRRRRLRRPAGSSATLPRLSSSRPSHRPA